MNGWPRLKSTKKTFSRREDKKTRFKTEVNCTQSIDAAEPRQKKIMKNKRLISLLLLVTLSLLLIFNVTSCAKTAYANDGKSRPGKGSGVSIYDDSTTPKKDSSSPTGKTVIVDPGHGFRDPGAGAEDYEMGEGIDERYVTLQVSLLLKQNLIDLGYNVIMSHEGKVTPEIKQYIEDDNWFHPEERALYFDTIDADCLVSLHCNMFPQDSSTRGTRVYVQKFWDESKYEFIPDPVSIVLADKIVESYNSSGTGTKDAISDMSDLAVLRGRAYPSTLIEMGFVSNPEDAKMLVDPEWQATFSKAVAEGIDNYLKENSQS